MWWDLIWIVVVLILVVVLPLTALYLRRRWITRLHSSFDCALRFPGRKAGAGWVLGIARYRTNRLEWFRSISFSMQPRITFGRGETVYVSRRPARGVEALELFEGSTVVTVMDSLTGREDQLGLDPDSAMALITWFESAPPGTYRPRGGESPG